MDRFKYKMGLINTPEFIDDAIGSSGLTIIWKFRLGIFQLGDQDCLTFFRDLFPQSSCNLFPQPFSAIFWQSFSAIFFRNLLAIFFRDLFPGSFSATCFHDLFPRPVSATYSATFFRDFFPQTVVVSHLDYFIRDKQQPYWRARKTGSPHLWTETSGKFQRSNLRWNLRLISIPVSKLNFQ